jgi:diguanylate cyclase (GGDEF)-like protein/PAS domain S-box-containing protein
VKPRASDGPGTGSEAGHNRSEGGLRSEDPPTRGVAKLFELSSDLLATLDRGGCFTELNPAWERVLGWSPADLLGRRAVDLLHPDDRERTLGLDAPDSAAVAEVVDFENRYRCKEKGEGFRWLQWNARLVDGVWYAVARDVTDRRLLVDRAMRDPLTDLPNRTAVNERIAQAVGRLHRHAGLVALLFVDLDHFKVINDGRGHEVGDRFLRAASRRLLETVRHGDTAARLGGDEFVVVVEDATRLSDVIDLAARVVEALKRPIVIDGDEVRIGASVGIALTSSAEAAPESLLREADIAMYLAKTRGGGCYELFDDAVRSEVHQRRTAERELRVAVDHAELVVHYQPIVALPDRTVSRCEALVRWTHPSRGLLLPAEFLAIAEETGLIVTMGEWVLREACRQAREWRLDGHDITITVNVSTRQLDQPGFADVVRAALAQSELPPAALCLEITETETMRGVQRVASRLDALRRIGVRIALDDFGSGYSSLTYLRALPLDIIKIDKSFVMGIIDDPQDRAVVAGIVMLGRQTERDVIAEGVETEALHRALVGLGCGFAQGFLYERARPAPELVLDGYSSRVRPGIGDPLVIKEFMRQIGIPARMGA